MSANDCGADRSTYLANGFDACISRSLAKDEFENAIRDIFFTKRKRRTLADVRPRSVSLDSGMTSPSNSTANLQSLC